jgi:VanZ family protein
MLKKDSGSFAGRLNNWQKYLFYHAPWQVAMLTIFVASSFSGDDLPEIALKVSDKLIHFIVFGVLGVMIYRSFEHAKNVLIRMHAYKLSILLAMLYGVLDEVHQYFVPGRDASIADWIADLLGAIIFLLIYRKIFSRRL